METAKKTLLIFIGGILVIGSAFGGFYILKRYVRKAPDSVTQATSTPVTAIPGFERDLNNKVPPEFPKNLISEKNIQVVESFKVVQEHTVQYTYRYQTNLSISENYQYFQKYLRSNAWNIQTINRVVSSDQTAWFLDAKRNENELLISFSQNKQNQYSIIDITYNIKK